MLDDVVLTYQIVPLLPSSSVIWSVKLAPDVTLLIVSVGDIAEVFEWGDLEIESKSVHQCKELFCTYILA